MIKIFVVDDDQSLQKLYSLILKEAGFEIIETAINGKDAIEKYKNLEMKPDIILMDHIMPIKNGLDTMAEIFKINDNEKIIFVSADITVKEKAQLMGACAFLDKPFKMKQLLILIQQIVNDLIIEHKSIF